MEWNRIRYGNDLAQFAKLVKKHDPDKIFKNLDSILSVAQGKLNGAKGNILSIEANGIELILKKRIAGTIPSDLQSVTILFESKSEFDLSIDLEVKDRILDTYNFQIGVKGINSKGTAKYISRKDFAFSSVIDVKRWQILQIHNFCWALTEKASSS